MFFYSGHTAGAVHFAWIPAGRSVFQRLGFDSLPALSPAGPTRRRSLQSKAFRGMANFRRRLISNPVNNKEGDKLLRFCSRHPAL